MLIDFTARILEEKSLYPQATLRDYYKLSFQAVYGPGHLIESRLAADRYLRAELTSMNSQNGVRIQDISFSAVLDNDSISGDYCRVSLNLIKEGIVSYQDYLTAFIDSSSDGLTYDKDMWINCWQKIEQYLHTNRIVSNFGESDALIKSISGGDPVSRHSEQYRNQYHPHYRLIKKSLLLELMEQQDLNPDKP